MNNIILPNNHYSITIANDVNAICKPIFEFGINSFIYARYFNNGSLYTFATFTALYQHHFKQEYRLIPHIPNKLLSKKFHYIAMPDGSNDKYNQAIYDTKKIFGINHPVFLFERYNDYLDMYIYSYNDNDSSRCINFYINNMDVLEKFKFYFKDKAHSLIKKSNKNKIVIPTHMRPNFADKNKKSTIDVDKIKLLNQLVIKNYILSGNYEDVRLTKRELDVLRYFAGGHTMKETARAIYISPKTVESYLSNIRFKLGTKKKHEIISILKNFGLL